MAEVGPGRFDLPSVWDNGVKYAFNTERHSDDAVVRTATQEALVEMLERHDAVAAKFRVHHVPCKEEYPYIHWRGVTGATRALRHAEYGQAKCRTKQRVLGSQVPNEVVGTRLRHRVRAAIAEWATVTIHLTHFATNLGPSTDPWTPTWKANARVVPPPVTMTMCVH